MRFTVHSYYFLTNDVEEDIVKACRLGSIYLEKPKRTDPERICDVKEGSAGCEREHTKQLKEDADGAIGGGCISQE